MFLKTTLLNMCKILLSYSDIFLKIIKTLEKYISKSLVSNLLLFKLIFSQNRFEEKIIDSRKLR